MQGIFQKENTDKALKYGIYRHLPTYEKIIRNLVSFYYKHYSKIPVCKPLVGQGTRQSSYTAGELLTEEGRQWYYDAAEDL